jgi:prepilin-type N-terminal cleavage/methylation domain-containing protein
VQCHPKAIRRRDEPGGFTFLEVMVVMAMLAVLMGLGVGYLTNIQGAAGAAQSLGILRETAAACKQSSNGGTRAVFDLTEDPFDQTLYVGASVAQAVLTHNFETTTLVSRDYPVEVKGKVEIVPDGYTGNAGHFGRGGSLQFVAQSSFAMTEGISLSVWVRPDAQASQRMTLIKGEDAYEVLLVRDQASTSYDVLLRLDLQNADDPNAVALRKDFQTKGAPVPGDGRRWSHLQVVYDGTDASIRVGGFEQYRGANKLKPKADVTPSEAPVVQRQVIAIPETGAVALSISGGSSPYVGSMDQLVLGGVFRSSEGHRKLPGLRLLRPRHGVRIVWRNGRLDSDVHSSDVVLLFQEVGGRQGAAPIEMRFGLYGLVTQSLAAAGEGEAP